MKKSITTLLFISLFALMVPMLSTNVSASSTSMAYSNSASSAMRPCTGSKYARFYKRNRNALNVALGAGVGTIIGSMVDGKRGALIGMGIGTGGGLLYTYKLNPKTKQCQKVYYRRA